MTSGGGAVLRFSRDKRGYEHFYLIHQSNNRRGRSRSRLLYWFRTPPGVKVGRPPFDDDMRRTIEARYPDITFDWKTLNETPFPPPPEAEKWRERRRAERAWKRLAAAEPAEEPELTDEVGAPPIAPVSAPIVQANGRQAAHSDGGRLGADGGGRRFRRDAWHSSSQAAPPRPTAPRRGAGHGCPCRVGRARSGRRRRVDRHRSRHGRGGVAIRSRISGPLLALGFLVLASVGLWGLERESALRLLETIAAIRSLGALAPLGFILVFALAVVAFVPASAVAVLGGAIFGVTGGLIYGLAGSYLGSTLAFLIGRHVAHRAIERRLAAMPGSAPSIARWAPTRGTSCSC